jgi:diguanylate cyclase (GGDEF)-like protein/PAS domain S-box-containing protein
MIQSLSAKKKSDLLADYRSLAVSEARFRIIAELAPVMLWMTDANGKSQFFNQKWLRFTGFTAHDSLQSARAWVEALHPQDRERCIACFQKAFQAHLPFQMEYRLRRYDGEYRWILDIGEPRHAPDGSFAGFVGSSQDITERKCAEEALRLSCLKLERHSRENTLLGEMNGCLQVCRSIAETYPVIRHYAGRLFGEHAGMLCLINSSRSLVEAIVEWGSNHGSETVFTLDDCWALRQGKPHLVDDPVSGLHCNHVKPGSAVSYLCLPMSAYGETMGVLHVRLPDRGAVENGAEVPAEIVRHLATTFADNMALAIANLRLREALQRQSERDPLTQLYNRRHMLDSLERELARARRNQSTVGIVMIDVDHFKLYNDTHGHGAGDAVLRSLGAFLKNQARKEDIACRYGGEEFVLVMAGINEENLLNRCEFLRRNVKQMTVEYAGQQLNPITLSMGAAIFPQHGETIEAVLNVADAALYLAKRSGRDRVELAASPSPPAEQ